MQSRLLKIVCLTNLHVGSGETNFNIVDREVEKDPVTKTPVIFSSGVKGALREHAIMSKVSEDDITAIFGSDRKVQENAPYTSVDDPTVETESTEKKKRSIENYSIAGNVKFLTAQMLAMPMRASMGKRSFYMITTKTMLSQFFNLYHSIIDTNDKIIKEIEDLDAWKGYCLEREGTGEIGVEGIEINELLPSKYSELQSFLQNNIAKNTIILPENAVREISLPILARNRLENGTSKNLWYEEVVPHDSIFYDFFLSNGTPSGDDALRTLMNILQENPLVQFGGNATIGCGLTKVEGWKIL